MNGKMKRKIIKSAVSLYLTLSIGLLTACKVYNYAGFVRYDLPDDLVGTVMLPGQWETVTDKRGWIQFVDTTTGEVVAEQIRRVRYRNDREEEERNSKYADLFPLEYVFGTGYSDGGQVYIWTIPSGIEIRTWQFYSDANNYCITLYILREDFTEDFIWQIAFSYRYVERA